jgi:hypothetical protein
MAGVVTDLESWLLDGKPAQPYRSNFSRRSPLLSAGVTVTAGAGFVVPVVCQQGDIITSITVGVKTATSSGTIHGWAALYTGLTTAATLITQSADNTSGFTSTGSAQTLTLGTPYLVGSDPGTTGVTGPLVLGVMLYNEGTTGAALDGLGLVSEAVAGGVYITGQLPLLFTRTSQSYGATAPANLGSYVAASAGAAGIPLVIAH